MSRERLEGTSGAFAVPESAAAEARGAGTEARTAPGAASATMGPEDFKRAERMVSACWTTCGGLLERGDRIATACAESHGGNDAAATASPSSKDLPFDATSVTSCSPQCALKGAGMHDDTAFAERSRPVIRYFP